MAVKTATKTQNKTTKTNKTTVITMAATTTKKAPKGDLAPTKKALDVYNPPSNTDVDGSYTGKPKNKKEIPVQDADDL